MPQQQVGSGSFYGGSPLGGIRTRAAARASNGQAAGEVPTEWALIAAVLIELAVIVALRRYFRTAHGG